MRVGLQTWGFEDLQEISSYFFIKQKKKVEDEEQDYDDYLDLQDAPEIQTQRRAGSSRWTDQDFV